MNYIDIMFHYDLNYFGMQDLEEMGNFLRAQVNAITLGSTLKVNFERDGSRIKVTPIDSSSAYLHFVDNKLLSLLDEHGTLNGYVDNYEKNYFFFKVDIDSGIQKNKYCNKYDTEFYDINGDKKYNLQKIDFDIHLKYHDELGNTQSVLLRNGKLILTLTIDIDGNDFMMEHVKVGENLELRYVDYRWRKPRYEAKCCAFQVACIDDKYVPLIKLCMNEKNVSYGKIVSVTENTINVGVNFKFEKIKDVKFIKNYDFLFEENIYSKLNYKIKKRLLTPEEFTSLYYNDFNGSLFKVIDKYKMSSGIMGEKTLEDLLCHPLGDSIISFDDCTIDEIKEWMKNNGEYEISEDKDDFFDASIKISKQTKLKGVYLSDFAYRATDEWVEIYYFFGIVHNMSEFNKKNFMDKESLMCNVVWNEQEALNKVFAIVNDLNKMGVDISLEYVDKGSPVIPYYEGKGILGNKKFHITSRRFEGLLTMEFYMTINR